MNNQLRNQVTRKQLREFVKLRKEEQVAIAEIEALQKIEADAEKQSKYDENFEDILKQMPNVGYLKQIIYKGDVSNIYEKYTDGTTDQQKKDIQVDVLRRRASVSNTESEDDIRRHLNMVRMQKLGEHLETVSINNKLFTTNPRIAKSKKQYDNESDSKNSNLRIAADVLALQRATTLREEENKEFQTERINGYLNMGYMLKNIPALFPDSTQLETMHKNARVAYCKLPDNSVIKTRMLENHQKPDAEDCSTVTIGSTIDIVAPHNTAHYHFDAPISISIQQWLRDSKAKHNTNKKYNVSLLIIEIQNSLRNLYANNNSIDTNYFFMQLVDNPFISYESTIKIPNSDFDKLEQITRLYHTVSQLLERATFLHTQKTLKIGTVTTAMITARKKALDAIDPFKRILEQTLPNIERLAREMLDIPEIRNAQVSAWLGIAAPLYDSFSQPTNEYPKLANSTVNWSANAGSTNGYTLLNTLTSPVKTCIFKNVTVTVNGNGTEYSTIRDFYIIYYTGKVEIGYTSDDSASVEANTDTESGFTSQETSNNTAKKTTRKQELQNNFTPISGGAFPEVRVTISEDTLPETVIGFFRDESGYIHLYKNGTVMDALDNFKTTDVNLRPYIKLNGFAKVEFRIGNPLQTPDINDQQRIFPGIVGAVRSAASSFANFMFSRAANVGARAVAAFRNVPQETPTFQI